MPYENALVPYKIIKNLNDSKVTTFYNLYLFHKVTPIILIT